MDNINDKKLKPNSFNSKNMNRLPLYKIEKELQLAEKVKFKKQKNKSNKKIYLINNENNTSIISKDKKEIKLNDKQLEHQGNFKSNLIKIKTEKINYTYEDNKDKPNADININNNNININNALNKENHNIALKNNSIKTNNNNHKASKVSKHLNIKELKYAISNDNSKVRISKKQKHLQYGETSIRNFMTKEDVNTLKASKKQYNIANKKSIKFSNMINKSVNNLNPFYRKCNNNKNQKNQSIVLDKNSLKHSDNTYVPRDTRITGKRKKNINRFKKAIYLSRLHKIYNFMYNIAIKKKNNEANTEKDNFDINENNIKGFEDCKLYKNVQDIKSKNNDINNNNEPIQLDNNSKNIKFNVKNIKEYFPKYLNSNNNKFCQNLNNSIKIDNNFNLLTNSKLNLSKHNYHNHCDKNYNSSKYDLNNKYNSSNMYYNVNFNLNAINIGNNNTNYNYYINNNLYVNNSNTHNQYYNNIIKQNNDINNKNIECEELNEQDIKRKKALKRKKLKQKQKEKNKIIENEIYKDENNINKEIKSNVLNIDLNKSNNNNISTNNNNNNNAILDNINKDGKFLFENKLFEENTKVNNNNSDNINEKDKAYDLNNVIEEIEILKNMNKEDFNKYLKDNKKVVKINLNSLSKIACNTEIINYIKNYEGLREDKVNNYKKELIREYVDQELSKDLDKKIEAFIVKLRDIYYKKKEKEPLKAKKRIIAGMKEVEKHLRLENIKCVFIVPFIEKVTKEEIDRTNNVININGNINNTKDTIIEVNSSRSSIHSINECNTQIKINNTNKNANTNLNNNTELNKNIKFKCTDKSSALDDRIYNIIWHCRRNNIPFFYCLNKHKLGKACRKKHSTISIAAIVNIEGLEREFKILVNECELQRINFYKNNLKKDYENNKFMDLCMFDKVIDKEEKN